MTIPTPPYGPRYPLPFPPPFPIPVVPVVVVAPPVNAAARLSFKLGILSLATLACCGIGCIVGIGAVITGVIGLTTLDKHKTDKSAATSGLIMGALSWAPLMMLVIGDYVSGGAVFDPGTGIFSTP